MKPTKKPIKITDPTVTSTGGMPHKQHTDRKVQTPPQRPAK